MKVFVLLEQSQFLKRVHEDGYAAVNLFFGVGCHKCHADECVLWSTCWWNDGVDEHTLVEGHLGDLESLEGIAHIEWNDGAFSIAYFKSSLFELVEGIGCDFP